MSKTLSVAEVAAHKDENSGMYIIIDENVYDVTSTYDSDHKFYDHGANYFYRIHRRTPRRLQNP